MGSIKHWIWVVIAIAFVTAGCRGSGAAASGQPDEPTGQPDQQGLATPESGQDPSSDDVEPRIVPPLELPDGAPGTDEAARELLDELDRFLTDEQRRAGVPWPDLRNADPVAVYQSAAAFQTWMSENNPTPSLVDAYTAPNSPERSFDLEMFDFLNAAELRGSPADPPYSMRIIELVHPAATGITDALLAQVPPGSAAIVYFDSVGISDTFTADGQYFSSDPGWTDVGPWVAIMEPTKVGWQVWWDELTEPPPPGSRQNGSPIPDEDRTRQDV